MTDKNNQSYKTSENKEIRHSDRLEESHKTYEKRSYDPYRNSIKYDQPDKATIDFFKDDNTKG